MSIGGCNMDDDFVTVVAVISGLLAILNQLYVCGKAVYIKKNLNSFRLAQALKENNWIGTLFKSLNKCPLIINNLVQQIKLLCNF